MRIIWIDASGSEDSSWTDLSELTDRPDRALLVESVGWLIKDGKHIKLLAHNLSVPDIEIGSMPAYFHDTSVTVAQMVSMEELVAKPPKRKPRVVKKGYKA